MRGVGQGFVRRERSENQSFRHKSFGFKAEVGLSPGRDPPFSG